ncbi:MAG: TatD family hydrolase [Raineya sp.]|nr:TatD family hydrolase [Raineya sp.]
MIDTHAHLYLDEFAKDRSEVITRSQEVGLQKIYLPNIDSHSIDQMLELELKYPNFCVATMGLHPCSVKKDFERELYVVEEWLNKRKFAAIGEMGTDLYWDKTFWQQQQEAFKIQAEWAKKYNLPLIIHCRNSIDETIILLENLQQQDKPLRGIFHCFTGNLEQAQKIIALGFYLGIGGVVTFKNSGLDKVLPHIDLDYLVLETDSPYLAPVPHRGKRNESSYLTIIAHKVAEIKNCSVKEVQEKTTQNAQKIFAY